MNLDDEILSLYRSMRHAHATGKTEGRDGIYRMLRRDHSIELYYEVELPEHVRFVHPMGTVLGRATYGDYFVVYHGCGVGSDLDGNRPVIGEGVVLFPGAKVLGRVRIGNNVFIQANTVVSCPAAEHLYIPDNTIVWQESGALSSSIKTRVCWRPTKRSVKERFFG